MANNKFRPILTSSNLPDAIPDPPDTSIVSNRPPAEEYPPIRRDLKHTYKRSHAKYRVQLNQKQPRGKADKRTVAERERDLAVTSDLYLKGHSHLRIAEYISSQRPYMLSRQTIDHDIHELHKRWLHAQLIDFNEAKARELAKIDRLEQAYWDSWERSQQELTKTQTMKTEDNAAALRNSDSTTFTRKQAKSVKQNRDGDPKFLEGILKCIQERCKIIGLYAPDKLDINWREEARLVGVDPEKLEADLYKQFMSAALADKDN